MDVFRDLTGRARKAGRAGDAAAARELFGQALGLWRGAALADAAPLCPRLAGEAAQLEEARLAVVEERIGADLALGRHREVAGELAGLVEEFPLRERLAALLMTALYRCGRRGEAWRCSRRRGGCWLKSWAWTRGRSWPDCRPRCRPMIRPGRPGGGAGRRGADLG